MGADDELPTERVNCNVRQADVLARAREEVRRLLDDVKAQVAYDLCAVRLDYIAQTLGEIIGVATAEDVLNAIFDRFCIGK